MMPTKLSGQGAHFFVIEVDVLLRRGWFAVGVVGVGGEAEADHAFIGLLGVGVELRQTGEVAEDDGEDTGGRRIEGSEMTDRALA